MYRVRFTTSGTASYGRLTPDQRRRILRIVGNIQLDPVPDNRLKFTLDALGAMYTIYRDHQGYWVAYHVDGDTINIVGVGVGGPHVP